MYEGEEDSRVYGLFGFGLSFFPQIVIMNNLEKSKCFQNVTIRKLCIKLE